MEAAAVPVACASGARRAAAFRGGSCGRLQNVGPLPLPLQTSADGAYASPSCRILSSRGSIPGVAPENDTAAAPC
jgi:hypothetical protein